MAASDPIARGSDAGRHVAALDGLRGLAAVVVVARHSLGAVALPETSLELILTSPLVVFLNSAGAVQLFFVLSGFVLAASLSRSPGISQLPQYLIRRIFRIHPPYVFAVLVAWSASFFYLHPAAGSGVGGLTRLLARVHLSLLQLAGSLLFPGAAYNQLSVGWSLEVEMILSFLMPVLLVVAMRTHWVVLLALCCAPLAVGENGLRVLKFAVDFGAGIALFLERERLGALLARVRGAGAVAYAVVALGIFVSPWLLHWNPSPAGDPRSIAVMAVGASALTAGGAFVPALGRVLAAPACLFLGRVSYSLYLLHLPLLLLLAPHFARAPVHVGQALLLFGSILTLGLPLSALSYRFVERPGIRLGNRVCAWIARRMGVSYVGSRLTSPPTTA